MIVNNYSEGILLFLSGFQPHAFLSFLVAIPYFEHKSRTVSMMFRRS